MAEEVEDIAPVVETADIAPSGGGMGGGAGGEPAVASGSGSGGVDAPSVAPVEEDIQATELNLDPADNVLTNNAQQVYNELYAPDRVSDNAPVITQQARDEQEEKKQKHQDEVLEAAEQQEKEAARRKEWMESEHDFAGMKMSGADLDKLLNFYANNPAMQDKLKDRMVKSGKTSAQADKAVQEFNEYVQILKKESEGKELTDEEKRRKLELSKNEDVKLAAQTVVDLQKVECEAKVTSQNNEQRFAKTEVSVDARQAAIMGTNQTATSGKVVLFNSYCDNPVKSDSRPQNEFNSCAQGQAPTPAVKETKIAAALNVKESSGASLSVI